MAIKVRKSSSKNPDAQFNTSALKWTLFFIGLYLVALPFADARPKKQTEADQSKVTQTTTIPQPVLNIKTKKDLARHLKTFRQLKTASPEWEWQSWQVALNAAILDETELALRLLDSLSSQKSLSILKKDEVLMARGRIYYQTGQLEQAIKSYSQVPRSSDQWLHAIEEKAWAQIRNRREDLAIKELMTLFSPLIEPHLSVHPYFALSLAHLQICDYTKVFKVGQRVQVKLTEKIQSQESLAQSQPNTHAMANQAIEKLIKGPIQLKTVSSEHALLPQNFFKDEFFLRHIRSAKQKAEKDQKRHKTAAYVRLQQLARDELKLTSQVLQKLHLVEAEVIQRMYLDENLKGQRVHTKKEAIQKDPNRLFFPYSKEVWLDEIDNYHVEVKDCPRLEIAGQSKK